MLLLSHHCGLRRCVARLSVLRWLSCGMLEVPQGERAGSLEAGGPFSMSGRLGLIVIQLSVRG
jgi:hypothetical protein